MSPSGTPATSTTSAALTQGSTLQAFMLTRPTRSQGDLASAATKLGALFEGGVNSGDAAAAMAAPGLAAGALDVDLGAQPGRQFSYRADNDRLFLMDANVAANMSAPEDVGAAVARNLFLATFQSALSNGLASAVGMDPAGARTSRIMQTEGVSGQPPVEKVSEYRFLVPRTINGIEVFDSGVEVFVHRTGKIARVTSFGPTVNSVVGAAGTEVPDANGYTATVTVNPKDLDTRVSSEHPSAQITPVGIRYWLPHGVNSAVVEPRQMYFVVPKATVNGQVVFARGTYVAYSLRNASAPATVWPTPSNNPAGSGQK